MAIFLYVTLCLVSERDVNYVSLVRTTCIHLTCVGVTKLNACACLIVRFTSRPATIRTTLPQKASAVSQGMLKGHIVMVSWYYKD